MIAAVAAVNIRGVRQAASVQNWSTALKVGALLALAVAGVALGDGFHRPDVRAFTTPLSFASLSAAGVALLGVLWAYEGWQNVTNSAGEAGDPQRTFARGIGFGTAALVAIYLTANAGYVAALGAAGVAATDRVAADAVRTLFGSGAAKLVTLVILVSIFSAANGMALTAHACTSRWRAIGCSSDRSATCIPLRHPGPRRRLQRRVGNAACGERHVRAAVHIRRIRKLDIRRARRGQCLRAAPASPGRAAAVSRPGYPVTPALFIAAATAIVGNTIVARPVQALIGLGIVATGCRRTSCGSTGRSPKTP